MIMANAAASLVLLAAAFCVAAVPMQPPALLHPPWGYPGYSRFPAYIFGQNTTGLDNRAQLAAEARYSMAIFGWTTALHGLKPPQMHEERILNEQCRQFSAARAPAPAVPCGTYRDVFVATDLFATMRVAMRDLGRTDYWIRDDRGKVWVRTYPVDNVTNITGQMWNFTNPRAADYFINAVVGEYAREVFTDTIYWDDATAEICNDENVVPSHVTPAERSALIDARVRVYARLIHETHAHNKWPMLALAWLYFDNASWPTPTPCTKTAPEWTYDRVLQVLATYRHQLYGIPLDTPPGFSRFQYMPLYANLSKTSPAQCRALFVNTRMEAARRIPHVWWYLDETNSEDLALQVAFFYTTQEAYDYFGASSGWDDKNWVWQRPWYDLVLGVPLGPPEASDDGFMIRREFHRNIVEVNCRTLKGKITPKPA